MAMDIATRFAHIWTVLSDRKNRLFLIPFSFLYALGTLALYTYIYNGRPLSFYSHFHATYTVSFTVLTLLISLLFGILLTLVVAKIREVKMKSLGVGMTGVVFGALAMGCPGCIFGLFPLLLGFLGIGGTLAVLPFNGVEFQIATVILLSISIFLLGKETDLSCDLPKKKKKG